MSGRMLVMAAMVATTGCEVEQGFAGAADTGYGDDDNLAGGGVVPVPVPPAPVEPMPLPNLQVSALSRAGGDIFPCSAPGPLVVSFTETNAGAGAAPSSWLGLYTGGTSPRSAALRPAQPAGASTAAGASFPVYWGPCDCAPAAQPTVYTAWIVADHPNRVAETNELDNASNAITLRVWPCR